MAENVQWIKLKVGMFDGSSFKKIKRAKIGGVSYRDKLTAVWFELLDLAGKCNCNGYLISSNEIPYQSYEDIAIMLDREEKEIELCMTFFINEQMVEIIDDVYCLTNFMQYQNQQGLEKIKERKRIAQAKWREKKQKTLLGETLEDELCVYCGEKADTIDHITAKTNGGKDILSNLVPACKRCNCSKGARDLLVFLNDPFSTFILKELVVSNEKLGVRFNEQTGKYEYVDIYKQSTSNLLSNSTSNSTSQSISTSIYSNSDNVEESDIEEKGKKKKVFIPPTIEEVEEYCKKQKYDLVNAGAFVGYYASVGWKVGKNKMKSWHSAVSGWQSREAEKKAKGLYPYNRPQQQQQTTKTDFYEELLKGTVVGDD